MISCACFMFSALNSNAIYSENQCIALDEEKVTDLRIVVRRVTMLCTISQRHYGAGCL